MSNNSIETACQKIYRDYPEFRGVSPKISSQPAGRTLLLSKLLEELPMEKRLPEPCALSSMPMAGFSKHLPQDKEVDHDC